jgi:plastocyanin
MFPPFPLDTRLARRPTAVCARSAARLAAVVALAVPAGSQAAALSLSISDAAGKPLVDAVALLEPVAGKAPPVKPMADVEISQSKRQFHPRVTLITTGTRATFPNFDTVRHHVYSFAPIKTFELKLYAGTPSAPVVFDKPGVAVLGCNIHDTMAAWVVVADTPWSARSGDNGRARIENIPAGSYKLRLWHPDLGPNVEPAPIAITIAGTDLEQAATLSVTAAP